MYVSNVFIEIYAFCSVFSTMICATQRKYRGFGMWEFTFTSPLQKQVLPNQTEHYFMVIHVFFFCIFS